MTSLWLQLGITANLLVPRSIQIIVFMCSKRNIGESNRMTVLPSVYTSIKMIAPNRT